MPRRYQRYQVYVEIGGRWCPMTRFKEISQALNWIIQYDPDGTVPIKIKDQDVSRFIPLDEAFGMVPNKKLIREEEDDVDWKQEGF